MQLTGRGGIIGDRSKSEKRIPLNNLFIVGGPYTLRGFECLGPFEENHPKGSHMYWSTGVHLWGPLPFHSLFPKLGRHFRTHLFYNLGNNNWNSGKLWNQNGIVYERSYTNILSLSADIRSSWGIGVAIGIFKLARVEINYHIPAQYKANDRTKEGFDFRLGVDFV